MLRIRIKFLRHTKKLRDVGYTRGVYAYTNKTYIHRRIMLLNNGNSKPHDSINPSARAAESSSYMEAQVKVFTAPSRFMMQDL